MIPTETVLSDLKASTEKLVAQLARFSPENFNRKPSENTWSAADVAEHLLLLEKRINKVLTGATITANRPPDEKINIFKSAFQNLETRRTAPEHTQPSLHPKEQQEIIAQLKQQRQQTINTLNTAELSSICSDYQHPSLGELTRLEWVYFNLYHTERHLHQLKKLETLLVK